jgi:hypothetical protein
MGKLRGKVYQLFTGVLTTDGGLMDTDFLTTAAVHHAASCVRPRTCRIPFLPTAPKNKQRRAPLKYPGMNATALTPLGANLHHSSDSFVGMDAE